MTTSALKMFSQAINILTWFINKFIDVTVIIGNVNILQLIQNSARTFRVKGANIGDSLA